MNSKHLLGLWSFLIISIVVGASSSFEENDLDSTADWDVLLFTQQWPITTCYHWMEEDNSHSCKLPQEKEFWTIHGIWPTKYGTVGPSFCNKSAEFDYNKIKNIEDKLRLYWPEIEGGHGHNNNSLWSHEWLKHGTCAVVVPELNDEEKYFNQGLEWRQKYKISDILGKSGIHPDTKYTVTNLQNAVRKYLNVNPSIHCVYDRENDLSFLSEIRICFNKTLELIDCDGTAGAPLAIDYPGGKLLTNCHLSKPVQYPSKVPPVKRSVWQFPFVNFYKLLNFVMWITL